MRICVIVFNSVWYDPRVRKQIEEYLRAGHEVQIVGYKCGRYHKEEVAKIPAPIHIVHIEKYEGKQSFPIKKLLRERLRNRAMTKAIIDTAPEVIHANDYDALVPAYAAAKKLGCVLIYDSHEIWVENAANKQLPTVYNRYMRWREKRMCRRLDQMVCVSHAAASYFAEKYGIPEPMVVTNCAPLRENLPETEKHEGFEVLNHGQFYEGRGYDIMVEAAPLLRDLADVKIAMRGFGRMEEQLRRRREELAGENVVFYPKVLVQELIPEAAKSHVGVAITEPTCLNFKLSVSNKLFEYAAAGLPVILSDIPEHRYLNDKYHFGLILEENSPRCFAQAVRTLYENHALYGTLRENALRLSREVNWETEFSRLIERERELAHEKK